MLAASRYPEMESYERIYMATASQSLSATIAHLPGRRICMAKSCSFGGRETLRARPCRPLERIKHDVTIEIDDVNVVTAARALRVYTDHYVIALA